MLHSSVGDKQVLVSSLHQETLHHVSKKKVRSSGIHLIKRMCPQCRASHLGCLAQGEKEAILEEPNKDKIGQVTCYKGAYFSPLVLTGAPRVTTSDGSSRTEDN